MTSFRTIEISNPEYETGHLRFMTVKTPNLKGRGDICLYVPPMPTAEPLPLVILLHGVYGSAWCWSQKGAAHHTAHRLISQGHIKPMVLAMPSDGLWGDGSAYLPHSGFDFEQWVVHDVPTAIAENIHQVSISSTKFISGLSMGGFGALRIGAKYGQTFEGISAHSSITALGQLPTFVEEPLEGYCQPDETGHSVWETIKVNQATLPPLRFDCGKSDPLVAQNRALHTQLENEGIPHQYQEFEGGHEWPYWVRHLEDSLLFFDLLLNKNNLND